MLVVKGLRTSKLVLRRRKLVNEHALGKSSHTPPVFPHTVTLSPRRETLLLRASWYGVSLVQLRLNLRYGELREHEIQ